MRIPFKKAVELTSHCSVAKPLRKQSFLARVSHKDRREKSESAVNTGSEDSEARAEKHPQAYLQYVEDVFQV
jgi:hypothetical protein